MAGTGLEPSRFRSDWVAWFMIKALILAGGQLGWSWRRRVATPDTCGVAIEVPENVIEPSPVPTAAEVMSFPGAETSGFRSFVMRAGPSEEKSVIRSA